MPYHSLYRLLGFGIEGKVLDDIAFYPKSQEPIKAISSRTLPLSQIPGAYKGSDTASSRITAFIGSWDLG
jgi:hypothetical protein